MTLIVFSDIHGNIYSFEKAMKEMYKYKADAYLFLGDMAGYYYYQNECINLIEELPNIISIKGNHDDNFLKSMYDIVLLEKLTKKYGKSYKKLAEIVTNKSLKYLTSMQIFEKNDLYEAYHGSPNNYLYEYIYPDNELNTLSKIRAPFLFMGHTHYLMKTSYEDTVVINPGSIGQPRDYNKPSFAVVDTVSNDVEFVRYDYDKKSLQSDILFFNDHKYLIEVLERRKNEI